MTSSPSTPNVNVTIRLWSGWLVSAFVPYPHHVPTNPDVSPPPPAVATVKLPDDVAVPPAVVTVMVPVVAPVGTVTVRDVVVAADTVAVVPLNLTVLFAAVVSKFVPEMVTVAPTAPLVGLKDVIVGAAGATTPAVGVALTSADSIDSLVELTAVMTA